MDNNVDVVLSAIIASVPSALAAVAAYRKAGQSLKKSEENHSLINSRMTELLELTRKSALAEGGKAGRDNP